MTTQEQQMLEGLTGRVNQTQLPEKDPEAERYLQDTLGRNPDALYILAQTVLVQQYALEQAQKQLADAHSQLDQAQQHAQPAKHTSFLGNLLGMNDQPTPPPPPQGQQQAAYQPVNSGPQYGQPQYAPAYAQPAYAQPAYAQPQSGGFLRSAMQTATGVAAGALAFQGIESLMHGFGGGGGRGFGDFGGAGGGREEIVNNYYGDQGREHSGMSSDVEDRRDLSSASAANDDGSADGTSGADYFNDDSGDTNSTDDSNFDDSGSDDSSSFDDSGSDDSSN